MLRVNNWITILYAVYRLSLSTCNIKCSRQREAAREVLRETSKILDLDHAWASWWEWSGDISRQRSVVSDCTYMTAYFNINPLCNTDIVILCLVTISTGNQFPFHHRFIVRPRIIRNIPDRHICAVSIENIIIERDKLIESEWNEIISRALSKFPDTPRGLIFTLQRYNFRVTVLYNFSTFSSFRLQ